MLGSIILIVKRTNVRFYKNGALIKEAPLVAEAGIDIPDKIEDTSSIKKKLIDLIKIGA